ATLRVAEVISAHGDVDLLDRPRQAGCSSCRASPGSGSLRRGRVPSIDLSARDTSRPCSSPISQPVRPTAPADQLEQAFLEAGGDRSPRVPFLDEAPGRMT